MDTAITEAPVNAEPPNAVSSSRQYYRPHHSPLGTLSRLPTETISEIILCCFNLDTGMNPWRGGIRDQRKRLQLVCRGFNRIVVDIAVLWAYIDADYTSTQIDLFIKRSKNVDLDVWVDFPEVTVPAFFKGKIMQHVHRWGTFTFLCDQIGNVYDCWDWYAMLEVQRVLQRLHLPRLRELRLLYCARYLNWGLPETETFANLTMEDIVHIHSTWTTPLLSIIHCDDILPDILSTWPSSVTFIDLAFSEFGGELWSPKKLLRYLSFLPCLVIFRLRMRDLPWSDRDRRRGLAHSSFPMVHLNALKELTIRAIDVGDTREDEEVEVMLDALAALLGHINAPALEQFTIRLWDDRSIGIGSAMADLIPAINDYNMLTTLHFTVHDVKYVPFKPFLTIFERLRNLQHLTLITNGKPLDASVPPVTVEPPPLQTLHLEYCQGITDGQLVNVLSYLRSGPRWNEFRELHLAMKPCRGDTSQHEFLKDLIPGTKVCLHDVVAREPEIDDDRVTHWFQWWWTNKKGPKAPSFARTILDRLLEEQEESDPGDSGSEASDLEESDREASDAEESDSEALDSQATGSEETDSEETDSEASDIEQVDADETGSDY